MKRIIAFLCSFILLSGALMAKGAKRPAIKDKDPNSFYGRCFSSSGDTLYYRVKYPKGYDQSDKKTKYPLVVVLHSENEAVKAGSHDNMAQILTPVAKLFAKSEISQEYPAIVVFPQCEDEDLWAQFSFSDSSTVVPFPEKPDQSYSGELTERMVKYYIKNYSVDPERVYLIGQGPAGGSGALDLAVRNPKMFAAVVSIGGAINQDRVKPLKKTPVRLYGSSASVSVPLTLVNDVFIGLKMFGSEKVEPVIDYPNVDDVDCVKNAVSTQDFLSWIFSKKK